MALDVYRDWLKIKSPQRPVDYYTLLGLRRFEDDRAVVQRHYRQRSSLVRRYATGKFAKESQDLLDELARGLLALTDAGRKGEYDGSLGRKTPRPPTENRTFGQILVDGGKLTTKQLQDAETLVEQLGIELRDALVQRGYVNWEEGTRALAQHYNMPYLNPLELRISPEVTGKVPAALATREDLFPLLVDHDSLLVGVTHALNVEALDSLRFQLGMPVRAVLCSPPAIRKLIEQRYGSRSKTPLPEQEVEPDEQEEVEKEEFSLAGWLWRNVKWLAPAVTLIGVVAGYSVWGLIGAVLGGIIAAVLFVLLLFVVG